MNSIPNAPKPTFRGDGRDPKLTGASPPPASHHREPFRPAQEPPPPGSSPWDAVDHIQALRDVLDAYFGSHDYAFDAWGYTTELDLAYQSTMAGLARFLDHVPCFEGMRQRAPIFEALPPALGALAFADRHAWREHWRDEAIAFQSEMVAALVAAGIPRSVANERVPEPLTLEIDTGDYVEVPVALAAHSGPETPPGPKRITAATRSVGKRREQVKSLHTAGFAPKEIAQKLQKSEKTIYDDLRHLRDKGEIDS